ncbi:unnamed protein product [Camellia sinensis]
MGANLQELSLNLSESSHRIVRREREREREREEQSRDTLSEEGYLPGTLLHLIKSITGANEKDFTLVLAIRGKVISYNVKSKTLKELHHLSTDDLDDWGASWCNNTYQFIESLSPV